MTVRGPLLAVALLATLPAHAAINPAEFTRDAPLQLRLRPTIRIVDTFERDGDTHRRTTIVATVVAEHVDTVETEVGDVVMLDWTVNLDAMERDSIAWNDAHGSMPGPQFLHAPAPPRPDSHGLIWANLQPDPTARVAPHHDATAPIEPGDVGRAGPILAPAAYQYSFDRPADADASGAEPPLQSVAALLASGQRRGLVRVHGCVHANTLSGLHLHPACGGKLDLARSIDLATYNDPLPFGMQDDQWKCVTAVGDWQRYGDDIITTGWASANGLVDHAALEPDDGCTEADAP